MRYHTTSFRINATTQGEPIEHKIARAINNKESLGDEAPLIFTEKGKGVSPAHNIRTDRFEIAIDGIDTMNKSYKARSEERGKIVKMDTPDTSETGNV